MQLDAPDDAPREVAALDDVRVRVQKHLEAFVESRADIFDRIGSELGQLLETLTELSDGGKRLRAAFCYWGWRGVPGRDPADDEGVLAAATALELLQASALVHDDVMDRSDTRRGRPSVHRRFAAMHRGNRWLGSPERFGDGAAILLGDLCLSWTDEMFLAAPLRQEQLWRAKDVLQLMRTEVMAGQYLDLTTQMSGDASPEQVMRVVRYKSATYTVERPLQLGGSLADASPQLLESYSAYGLPVGEAFQLRDDVLGVFGDPARTGKPAGDDLREGKQTLLVVLALQRATPSEAALVRRMLGDPALDEDALGRLREVIVRTGALAEVEHRIGGLTERARTALADSTVDPDAGAVLDRLAVAATVRTD